MTAYLLLLFGAMMISVQFVFLKKFQMVSGESVRSALFFSLFYSVAGAVYMLVLSGFRPEFSPFSAVMASLMALDALLIAIVGMKTMHMGKLSVYTLFMMLGGMIVPFFMGVFALSEKPGVFCIFATVLVILSLSLPVFEKRAGGKNEKNSKRFYFLCVLLFFLNGAYSCLSKLHQINDDAVSTYGLLFTLFTAGILLSGALLLTQKAVKKDVRVRISIKSLLYCVAYAFFTGTGGFFIISGASTVDATVLYPIVTGATVIFSAINGRVLFKEKLNRFIIAEIALALAATVLFMF